MNEIDFTNPPLNLEQECGNGYIKFTDYSSNSDTGLFHMAGEMLNENHGIIGNFTGDAYIHNFRVDDHNMNIQLYMEMDCKGDIKKILSL
uniref:Uncharacterized protein n=1 Tax=Wolbachia endosymbiont of Oeneis ivallda TaxID=3171168 RepID=A0AAU7YMS3_9RICK